MARTLGMQALDGATIETRMSLLQRQLGVGDACTFRLIEKNVVSLLPPSKDELKNDAKRALTDLIRCVNMADLLQCVVLLHMFLP